MSASFCPECGNKLLPDAKFCSKCGTRIKNKPAAAQTQVQTSGFCAKCGSPLLVGAVTQAVGRRFGIDNVLAG